MQAGWRCSSFVFALSCCAALATGQGAGAGRLSRAEAEFRAGHYKTACRLALAEVEAAKQSGSRAQALQLLAAIYYHSGRLGDAVKCGEQCLDLLERPGIRDV